MLNSPDESGIASDVKANSGQSLLATLDFDLSDIDVVSDEYKITLVTALLLLLLQFSILAALIWGLIWGLLAMLANFSKAPYACFWGVFIDAIVLMFLLKPFLFRAAPADSGRDQIISRDDEPLLYEFIEKLCLRINAPAPDTIVLSLDANVGVCMKSLINGKMELTLGLPLLSVFPLRILIAVLAHDLGHFRQRGAMRLSHLVFFIHRFMHKVLYERDPIDRFFEHLRSIRNIYLTAANFIIFIFVESMRGLLWLLLVSGLWMTIRLKREMEFDADRFAAKLAGRDELAKVLEALHFVNIGALHAMCDVNATMQERALPDDVVQLAVAEAVSMARYKDEIIENLRNEQTHWNSSHPCLTDRLNNIADIENTSVLQTDTPSTQLLGDFTVVCQRLTRRYYNHQLGDLRKRIAMISSRKLAAWRIHSRHGKYRVQCYFRTGVGITRRILLSRRALVRADDASDALKQLHETRAKLMVMHPSVDIQTGPELESLTQARTVIRGHIAALELMMTLVWKVHRNANLRSIQKWRRKLTRQARQIEKRITVLSDIVHPLDAISRRRLELAMSLLHTVMPMAPDTNLSQLRSRAACLAKRSEAIGKVAGLTVQMREYVTRLDIFARQYSPVADRSLAEPIHLTAKTLVDDLAQFIKEFSERPELIEMAAEQAAMGRILPLVVADPTNLGELRRSATAAFAYLCPVVEELQTHTADMAAEVEQALGLEVLPAPLIETEARRAEKSKDHLRVEMRYWIVNGIRAAGGLAAIMLIMHFISQAIAH